MYKKLCNNLGWKLHIVLKGEQHREIPQRVCIIGRSHCSYIDKQEACPLFVPVPVKRRKKYTKPAYNSSWFKTRLKPTVN
jgi:hypothetical protein